MHQTVLTMVRWLLEQSPLPPAAAFTRAWRAREGGIANAELLSAWDKARGAALAPYNALQDGVQWVQEHPGASAGVGLGTVLLAAAMNAPALIALASTRRR